MKKEDKSKIIKKFKKGILLRNYSGQLTYEINQYNIEKYEPAKKRIAKEFGLLPFGITINGFDESFQTFIQGTKRIGIEWDNWSGLIFVAKSEKAEELIKEIAEYCEKHKI